MEKVIVILIVLAMVLIPSNVFADAGVSVTLTTTVTGDSGGGGGGAWYSNPTAPLTWEELFPQLKQQQPQSSAPYVPPDPAKQYIPLPIPQKTSSSASDSQTVAPAQTQPLDASVLAWILFWAVLIGIGVWALYGFLNPKKDNDEEYYQ